MTNEIVPNTVQVRAALPEDAEQIRVLARQLTKTVPFDEAGFLPSFKAIFDNPMATLLVAHDQGRAVGYLLGYRHSTFWAGSEVWWIEELLVNAGERGRGTGKRLVCCFEEQAQRSGATLTSLITRNSGGFYQILGYEEFGHYFRKDLRKESFRHQSILSPDCRGVPSADPSSTEN